ncbi:MAG: TonB-dependent receptor [Alphaproteobacteria bacterium]|nr:TonB-dependent receptor [Alphaproteobacteria bacterium]MBL7098068.1 TonB-dependent receptor [Alphaproteobacteria bacterium]
MALRLRSITLALLLSSVAVPATADSRPETVVVSATRTPTDLSKIGSEVSVITATDIRQQQTVFVTDILQTTPGLTVNQSGPRGTNSSVQLRGAPTNETFVLLDGVEVSDPSRTQSAFDFSELTASGIDRIEILRGSQSVLYGGDAVGGVISIDTARGRADLDVLGFGEGGSYDTYMVGGRIQGGLDNDRFGYNATLQYLNTGGFSAADSNLPGNTEPDGYRNLSSNGRFDFSVNDMIDLKLVYRYADGKANFDFCGGPFCDAPNYGDYFTQYSGRFSANLHNLLNGMLEIEAGAQLAHNERTNFDGALSDYYYKGDRDKYDLKGVLTLNPDNIVVFGVETKRDSSRSDTDLTGHHIRDTGFYAEYEVTPIEALSLTFGARLDDNGLFGTHATYRATAAYNIGSTGTKLKGSYATGFRPPSLFELFGACCGDPNLGNPALKPEISRSFDAGFDQNVTDNLTFGVTYFRLEAANLIEFGGVFGTPGPHYFNVPGTTVSNGVEVSGDWAPIDDLTLNLAYTYNYARDATGVRLQHRPESVLNFNANYVLLGDKANVNLNVRYTSNTLDTDFSVFPGSIVNLGSYAVVNLGGSYKILDNVEVYARAENLFDQKYETAFGYGTAQLSGYGGIRVSL